MTKAKGKSAGRATHRGPTNHREPAAAWQIMKAASDLYIRGQHLTVGGIAEESGISRVTISKLFKDDSGTPTVKVIEDRIIATILGETRAAIFDYLRKQGPLVAENPLDQLITVCRAALDVFDLNPSGMKFVAHRLTDMQEHEALTLMVSRVDEMLRGARDKGQLEGDAGEDLRKLRLILFGILRGLLTLLPVDTSIGAGSSVLTPTKRAVGGGRGKRQSETITAKDVEIEFLKIIQLHVNEAWKGHVNKYIEASGRLSRNAG